MPHAMTPKGKEVKKLAEFCAYFDQAHFVAFLQHKLA